MVSFNYSRADIAQIVEYKRSGKYPSFVGASSTAQWRFKHKFDSCAIDEDNNTVIKDGKPLVAQELIISYLQVAYHDPKQRLNGRDCFHRWISETCYGITAVNVNEFLKGQETHQVHQLVYRQKTVKPQIPTWVSECWQIDTISMQGIDKRANDEYEIGGRISAGLTSMA